MNPEDGASSLVARLLFGKGGLNSLEERTGELMRSDAFREDLKKEMLRSDRTNSPLTLLVFDVIGEGRRPDVRLRGLERLAAAVVACSRKTDVKGWHRDASALRVGVILHHTLPDKAEAVIEKVRENFNQDAQKRNGSNGHRSLDLGCEIYAYPGDRQTEEEGPSQLWLFDEEMLMGLDASPRSDSDHDGRIQAASRNGSFRAQPFPLPAPSAKWLLASPLPRWKRLLDLFGSTVGLILLSPLFLLVAIAIKLSSRGPVFFKQKRVGYLGQTFLCWKFRSMRENADASTHQQYLRSLIGRAANDVDGREAPMVKLDAVNPQITWVGDLLRKTCIDELPQLINVFLGEMSLVGPRPCLPYEAAHYLRWHTRRFDIVPGMTGLWQVMGKNRTTFRQMIRLDITYQLRCSFWLDVKILLLTIPAVINEFRDGTARKSPGGRDGRKESAESNRIEVV